MRKRKSEREKSLSLIHVDSLRFSPMPAWAPECPVCAWVKKIAQSSEKDSSLGTFFKTVSMQQEVTTEKHKSFFLYLALIPFFV